MTVRTRGTSGPPTTTGLFQPGEAKLIFAERTQRGRGTASVALPGTERARRRRESSGTMAELRAQGQVLGKRFGLRYRSLTAEREGVNGHYGICYEDGTIRIRLRHARTGRLLKQSSLVDTLCHELAHLRYLDHSIRFQKLYQRVLEAARELGYYRPGPQDRRPVQLTLFGGGCGTRSSRTSPDV